MNIAWHQRLTRTTKTALGIALLCLLPGFALASSAAVALDSEGQGAWAVWDTQAQANRAALDRCQKNSKTGDCKLHHKKAVVRVASAGDAITYAWSDTSLADAKKTGLKACGQADCKVTDQFQAPGFFALARSSVDGADAAFFLTYGYSNGDQADEDAKAGCARRGGKECVLVISSAIPGTIKQAKAPAAPAAPATPSAEKSCRPNTPTVRCQSQCTNGNCVVTYENGCKMRVQVRPKYDPFSNQWTYPSPSC